MIPKRVWERARNLAGNPSCGSRIRPELGVGLGTESRPDSESGVGVYLEAHAESAAVSIQN